MHEAQHLPVSGQTREVLTDPLEQCHGSYCFAGRGISLMGLVEMAVDDVVHQRRHVVTSPGHGKVLDGADTQVATRHPGQDRTRLDLVSNNGLASGNGGECTGGGYA